MNTELDMYFKELNIGDYFVYLCSLYEKVSNSSARLVNCPYNKEVSFTEYDTVELPY